MTKSSKTISYTADQVRSILAAHFNLATDYRCNVGAANIELHVAETTSDVPLATLTYTSEN